MNCDLLFLSSYALARYIMVYSLVIDTAYLFERAGASKTSDSPSLRETARHVLNMTLPDIHDSVRDAGIYDLMTL